MNLMLFLFVAEKTRGGEGGGTLGIYHNMITVLLDLVSSCICQVLGQRIESDRCQCNSTLFTTISALMTDYKLV